MALRLLQIAQDLGRGPVAGLHRPVEVALVVDRGVLAGEVAVALALALGTGDSRRVAASSAASRLTVRWS
jgi:hypothetical protein